MRRSRAFWALSVLLVPATAFAIMARDYTRTFTAHNDEVLACNGSAIEGTVTLEMDIGPRGRLGARRVVEAAPEALRPVGQCILGRAAAWTFEPSTSGGGGRYLFSFADGRFGVRRLR